MYLTSILEVVQFNNYNPTYCEENEDGTWTEKTNFVLDTPSTEYTQQASEIFHRMRAVQVSNSA